MVVVAVGVYSHYFMAVCMDFFESGLQNRNMEVSFFLGARCGGFQSILRYVDPCLIQLCVLIVSFQSNYLKLGTVSPSGNFIDVLHGFSHSMNTCVHYYSYVYSYGVSGVQVCIIYSGAFFGCCIQCCGQTKITDWHNKLLLRGDDEDFLLL